MKTSCIRPPGAARILGITAALFSAAVTAHCQNFTTLYDFATSSAINGSKPDANLILSGNTLYGTTSSGGLTGSGTVFKVNTDNSGFSVIYNFSPLLFVYNAPSNNADGGNPQAGLLLSGNTLFGTAFQGGPDGWGTIFKINTDGSGFTNLHSFTNGFDGAAPRAVLVLSGDTLYGTASQGGSNHLGTIFSISTNGLGFTSLHTFSQTNLSGVNFDGAFPQAGLILSNDILYGTASAGGTAGWGTVFSFNTSTLTFATVYDFTNGTDGAKPNASLILSDSTLYGTATTGGSNRAGTVFAVGVGGTSGFNTFYQFSPLGTNKNNADGAAPEASLILSGNKLYGTTSAGGSAGDGTLFSITLGAGQSGFTNLYNFSATDTNGDNSGGANPQAGLLLSSNTLFGTAFDGGDGGNGTLFDINTNGTPSSFGTVIVFRANTNGFGPVGNLISSGATLYGNTEHGFVGDGGGTVYSLNTNGSGFGTLFNFAIDSEGIQPASGMILSGNQLYGGTIGGGTNIDQYGDQGGTIYSLNIETLEFMGFAITDTNAASPIGNLILSGDTLYGTGSGALGPISFGGVFKINTDGSGYILLHGFTDGSDGSYPLGGLILSGDILYGTTGGDGISTFGSVFSISTNGAAFGFTNIYSFTNGIDGFSPYSSLVLSGNTLYGTAAFGAANGEGTVFKVNTDTTGFTNIHQFSVTDANAFNQDGAFPYGGVILSGNTLYGTTAAGGPAGNGTVYQVNTDGSAFQVLHSFSAMDPIYSTNSDGAASYASLLLAGGALYGVTVSGGEYGGGTVFTLPVSLAAPPVLYIKLVGTNVVLTWDNPTFGLQSALALQGGYTDLVGATSPYTNAVTGTEQIFRLKATFSDY